MDIDTLFSALIGAGAALATSTGQALLQKFFDKAEKRESLRDSDLQVLKDVVFEIRDLATAYWAVDPRGGHESITSGAIVGRLVFASSLIEELFTSNVSLLREMHIVTNDFDLSCTSGSFGGISRVAEPDRCRDIEI